MKKFLLLFLLLLVGCKDPKSAREAIYQSTAGFVDYGNARTVKIGNCTYISSHVNSGNVYLHCSDCSHCAEVRRKEIQQICDAIRAIKE